MLCDFLYIKMKKRSKNIKFLLKLWLHVFVKLHFIILFRWTLNYQPSLMKKVWYLLSDILTCSTSTITNYRWQGMCMPHHHNVLINIAFFSWRGSDVEYFTTGEIDRKIDLFLFREKELLYIGWHSSPPAFKLSWIFWRRRNFA